MAKLKIKNRLMTLFNVLFILIFGYICLDTIMNPSELFAKMNPVIIILLAVGALFGMYRLNSRLEKSTNKQLILISIASFTIIGLLQLFFIKYFRVIPKWDFGTVYDSAVNSLESFTQFDSYFYMYYPNNIPLFIFESWLIHLFDNWGISDFYTALTFVNMGVVLLALGCLYTLIYRRYGLARATLFSIFMLFVTPLYSYTTIIYTDTLSMLFPILGLLLYDIFYHSNKKSRYLVLVLLALVLTLGTLMKNNVIILVAGIMIHYFMTQKSFKAILAIVILGGIFMVLNSKYEKAIEPYIPIEMDQVGYPMTHWVMMGLKGNGNYDLDDDAFTRFLKDDSYLSQEDISKEHLAIIKQRLEDFGFTGLIKHFQNKLNFTWADGTYYATYKIMRHPIHDSVFQEYVFGSHNQVFVYLSQVSHVMMFLLILLSGIRLFRSNGFESVMTITLFGVILFLLIWETRSRYLVLFLPMMIALASFGFDEFKHQVSKLIKK